METQFHDVIVIQQIFANEWDNGGYQEGKIPRIWLLPRGEGMKLRMITASGQYVWQEGAAFPHKSAQGGEQSLKKMSFALSVLKWILLRQFP